MQRLWNWYQGSFVGRIVELIGQRHLTAFAAALAYGAVFATVPILVLLFLILGAFDAVGFVARALDELRPVIPKDMFALLEEDLLAAAESASGRSLGAGAVVTALIALWGASGAMRRMMDALNVVNECEETRSFVHRMVLSIVLAVGALALLTISLMTIVVGGDVAARVFAVLGLGSSAEEMWALIRWPLMGIAAWLGIAGLYRLAPAQRRADGFSTIGTIVAVVGWMVFSAGFSWYVGAVAKFGSTWGAVAGLIVFLLYLQYAGLIVLVGALVNVVRTDRRASATQPR